VSFCDSAVMEFRLKLKKIAAEESPDRVMDDDDEDVDSDERAAAEDFARVEHLKRGTTWSSGRSRRFRDNAAGREAGRALEVVRGLSASGGGQKQLGSGSRRG